MASNTTHGETSGGGETAVMDLLRSQRELYRRLHRLAERQRGLVAENDSATLLALLGDRQKLIQSLLEVGHRLAPHRDAWAETRQALAERDREEAEQILAEVSTVLGKIIAADEEDSRLLSARKVQTASTLEATHSDRKAVSAYAAASGPPPSFRQRISEES